MRSFRAESWPARCRRTQGSLWETAARTLLHILLSRSPWQCPHNGGRVVSPVRLRSQSSRCVHPFCCTLRGERECPHHALFGHFNLEMIVLVAFSATERDLRCLLKCLSPRGFADQRFLRFCFSPRLERYAS